MSRPIIANTLILLAISKATVIYFLAGRVNVTFIVDTIPVVMLTKVISKCFKGGDRQALTALCAIVLALGVVRAMTVR